MKQLPFWTFQTTTEVVCNDIFSSSVALILIDLGFKQGEKVFPSSEEGEKRFWFSSCKGIWLTTEKEP